MVWTKPRILQELQQYHKAGKDLSYNGLAKQQQSLVSAAAYHFGSYRRAISQAGIDYDEVIRRPRWSKAGIIALIKKGRRSGHDLHWSAVTRRKDELAKAAFASLQPRLFGRWDRALQAAGLDADEISRYRKWDANTIVYELKTRAREQQPLNSGAIQDEDPGLHAAAVRHFGTYDDALRAAKLDPSKVRRRKTWTQEEVIKGIKQAHRAGRGLADSTIRRESPALYGAAIRLYGAFTTARQAAGVKYSRATPGERGRSEAVPVVKAPVAAKGSGAVKRSAKTKKATAGRAGT